MTAHHITVHIMNAIAMYFDEIFQPTQYRNSYTSLEF